MGAQQRAGAGQQQPVAQTECSASARAAHGTRRSGAGTFHRLDFTSRPPLVAGAPGVTCLQCVGLRAQRRPQIRLGHGCQYPPSPTKGAPRRTHTRTTPAAARVESAPRERGGWRSRVRPAARDGASAVPHVRPKGRTGCACARAFAREGRVPTHLHLPRAGGYAPQALQAPCAPPARQPRRRAPRRPRRALRHPRRRGLGRPRRRSATAARRRGLPPPLLPRRRPPRPWGRGGGAPWRAAPPMARPAHGQEAEGVRMRWVWGGPLSMSARRALSSSRAHMRTCEE